METLLYNDLDRAFTSLPPVYKYALTGVEQDKEPDDDLTKQVREFSGEWAAFDSLFTRWAAGSRNADSKRFSLKRVFSDGEMLKDLDNLGVTTPLIFKSKTKPKPFDAAEGSLKVRVSDPIGNWEDEANYLFEFPGLKDAAAAKKKRENIIKLLKPLEGKFWRSEQIEAKIGEYYADRGLLATSTISPAESALKQIKIIERARLARILFTKDVPLEARDRILYLLLADKDFHSFVEKRPHLTDIEITNKKDDGTEEKVVLYNSLDYCQINACQKQEPYINQLRFQTQQLELSQLGFVASQGETPHADRPEAEAGSYVDLVITKAEEGDEAKGERPPSAPDPVAPVPNEEGIARTGNEELERRAAFVPPAASLAAPIKPSKSETGAGEQGEEESQEDVHRTWTPKDRKNFLGGGIIYRTGQGTRLFGVYQRSRLGLLSALGLASPNESLSVKAGDQQSPLGDLSYSADFVLFNFIRRHRLSLQFTGSSDFEARRILAGLSTDERRTGGLGRAELEMFRDRGGSALHLYLEGRHDTVTLLRGEQTIGKQNLTTLDFGGLYTYGSTTAFHPRRLRLEPRLRTGLGLARGESRFNAFLLTGNYHQLLSRYFEADLGGQLEFASRRTPLFEQPSFGGSDVVRGFRRDDAIGRRLWSLQNELWLPVPGTTGSETGIGKFLRRQVRLAAFVDVGGVYDTTGAPAGVRAGPGLGLRALFNPVIIKLDWAYGIGDTATGRGHGRIHFGFKTNLPF
jgi:hypothetical protein